VKKLFLFTTIVLFLGCEENTISDPSNSQNDLEDLNIESIKSYLPSYLQTESSLVYIDEDGNERKLRVHYGEEVVERIDNGESYSSDGFSVLLTDEIVDCPQFLGQYYQFIKLGINIIIIFFFGYFFLLLST